VGRSSPAMMRNSDVFPYRVRPRTTVLDPDSMVKSMP
jgi:hypothetical protein